jgi:leader peptidase (prepilin peptidase)/N-methyltransferase
MTPTKTLEAWLADPVEWRHIQAAAQDKHLWAAVWLGALWAWLSAGFVGGAILAAGLLLLSVVDFKTLTLPNALVLPLLACGLALAPLNDQTYLGSVMGAVIGGGSFFALAWGVEKFLGKQGLGMGDVKLLAALGAWVGPLGLLPVVLFSSWAALGYALYLRWNGKKGVRIPFGPFLATGGWLAYIYTPRFISLLQG